MTDITHRTPGQLIQELLDSCGWTQRVLAIVLGAEETGVNKLISGKKPLDAETAIALGELFNVPAEQFLELQKLYDLAQARIVTRPDPGRTTRAHLFGRLPISEMIKRGWIEAKDVRDVSGVQRALMKFFGVKSADEIEILPHAAKRTNVVGEATPVQLAWLYRVREIAQDMLVARYSPQAAKGAVGAFDDLLLSAEEARKVPRILAESGVRFLLVESLPGAKIDGTEAWMQQERRRQGATWAATTGVRCRLKTRRQRIIGWVRAPSGEAMSKRTRCRAGHRNPTSEKNRRRERAPLGSAIKWRNGRPYWARKIDGQEIHQFESMRWESVPDLDSRCHRPWRGI